MNKRDLLDTMVVFTAIAFFILLLLTIGGKYEYFKYVLMDLLACILFMRSAHRAHARHYKGRFSRMIRERKITL